MRTFKCVIDGIPCVIKAVDFRRPAESQSGCWEFVDSVGKVIAHFGDTSITACVEAFTVVMETLREDRS